MPVLMNKQYEHNLLSCPILLACCILLSCPILLACCILPARFFLSRIPSIPHSVLHTPVQCCGSKYIDLGSGSRVTFRAVDPHSFIADPDPAVFHRRGSGCLLTADPQPWLCYPLNKTIILEKKIYFIVGKQCHLKEFLVRPGSTKLLSSE